MSSAKPGSLNLDLCIKLSNITGLLFERSHLLSVLPRPDSTDRQTASTYSRPDHVFTNRLLHFSRCHSAGYAFIYFWIIQPIPVTLNIEYRLRRLQPGKLHCCMWKDLIKPSLRSFAILRFHFQRQPFRHFILLMRKLGIKKKQEIRHLYMFLQYDIITMENVYQSCVQKCKLLTIDLPWTPVPACWYSALGTGAQGKPFAITYHFWTQPRYIIVWYNSAILCTI